MLPFDLPPPIPIREPAPQQQQPIPLIAQIEGVSAEEEEFQEAISVFQEQLSLLPPDHKAEIREIHRTVTEWGDEKRRQGERADKLSTFVSRVMTYADEHLQSIEKADPKLRERQAEHQQFQELFVAGNDVIESYLSWIRSDKDPRPISIPMPKKSGG